MFRIRLFDYLPMSLVCVLFFSFCFAESCVVVIQSEGEGGDASSYPSERKSDGLGEGRVGVPEGTFSDTSASTLCSSPKLPKGKESGFVDVPQSAGIALDCAGWVWLTNELAQTVYRFHPVLRKTSHTFKLKALPLGIWFDRKAGLLYVGYKLADGFTIINVRTGQQHQIPTAGRVKSLTFVKSGRVFLVHPPRINPRLPHLSLVDTVNRRVLQRYEKPWDSHSAVFSPHGTHLVVANHNIPGRLYRFLFRAGDSSIQQVQVNEAYGCGAMAFSADGKHLAGICSSAPSSTGGIIDFFPNNIEKHQGIWKIGHQLEHRPYAITFNQSGSRFYSAGSTSFIEFSVVGHKFIRQVPFSRKGCQYFHVWGTKVAVGDRLLLTLAECSRHVKTSRLFWHTVSP